MAAYSIFQGVEDKVDRIVTTRDEPPSEKQVDTFLMYLLALEFGLGSFAIVLQIPALMIFTSSGRSGGKDAIKLASFCVMMGLILILSLQQWLMLVVRNSSLTRHWKLVCRFLMVSLHGALCFIFLVWGMMVFVNACEFSTNQTNSYSSQFMGLIFGAWLVSLLIYISICLMSLFVGVVSLYLLLEFCTDKTSRGSSTPTLAKIRPNGKTSIAKVPYGENV